MKAIVQLRYGSPDGLALRDVPVPEIGDDGVLVRVRAASVNAMDWGLMRRVPSMMAALFGSRRSRVRGTDLAGEVAAVGSSVTEFAPGDAVFGVAAGAFAEFAATSTNRVVPMRDGLGFEQAAALPVAGCSALQALRDAGKLRAGERVLVHGAGGGVGTLTVQIAKWLGAHVTAVTRAANRELLLSLGADAVIAYDEEDFSRRAERYNLLLDVGGEVSWADCRRVLTAEGRMVHVGAGHSMARALGLMAMFLLRMNNGGRRIMFMARIRREDLLQLAELVASGRVTPVIERRYPLAEVPEALRHVGTRQARGKVVISIADP